MTTSITNAITRRADLNHARNAYHYAIYLAHLDGHSTRTIAAAIGVSHQTIHNIIQRHKHETGIA